jgi:hypothetical protein
MAKDRKVASFIKTTTLLLTLVTLLGCASMRKKFLGTTTVNMSPFAENTLLLLSELDYGLKSDEIYFIEKYLPYGTPDGEELRELVKIQRTFLKGILQYSIAIVNLNEEEFKEAEKVAAYRTYLAGLVEWFIKTGNDRGAPTSNEYEKILEKVGKAKELLGALRAAQPLITRFNQINLGLAQEIAVVKARVVVETQRRLDKDFAGTRALVLSVQDRREEAARRLKEALDARPRNETLIARRTKEHQDANTLWVATAKDLNDYMDLKKHIGRVVTEHEAMVRRGGKTIYLWTNAHKKMASGLKNPAEWFPVNDMSTIVGTAKKAVF